MDLDGVCLYFRDNPGEFLEYSCTEIPAADRRRLTLELDLRGLVAVKTKSPAGEEFIHVTESVNESFDPENLTAGQLRYLSTLLGLTLTDSTTVQADLALLGFDARVLTDLGLEFRKFGCQGLVRRDKIIEHEVAAELQRCCGDLQMPESIVPEPYRSKYAKNVYAPRNDGRVFVSVDLRAAVFYSFRDLAPAGSRLAQASSWSEFLAGFTSSKTLALNKGLRLRVFGRLKKQRVETLWQNQLWRLLSEAWPDAGRLVAFGHDEFVLAAEPEELPLVHARLRLADPDRVRLLAFKLHALEFEFEVSKQTRKHRKPMVFFCRQHLDLATGDALGSLDVKCAPGGRKLEALRLAQGRLAPVQVLPP